jgi:hypothetical protein
MGITQGAPLPDITQTQTTSTTAPDYYTNYLTDLSQAGQTAMGRTGAESIAGYDPLQTLGYGQVETAAGAYKPGLTSAANTAATAAGGITPERLTALMNPYTQNVVDEMGRLSQQNVQRNLLPMLKAGFVGSGGLGSRRYAGALGQSLADIQTNLTGQQYGALSKGYSEALKAALDEGNLLNQAARTQADIAAAEQSLGLTGAGALTKAGAERQAYQQSILDAPLKTATTASGLMRGYTVPTTQTETFVGPKGEGYYQKSDLDKIMGIVALLGAAQGGTKDTAVGVGLKSIWDKIKGGGSAGTGSILDDWTQFLDPKYFTDVTGDGNDTNITPVDPGDILGGGGGGGADIIDSGGGGDGELGDFLDDDFTVG